MSASMNESPSQPEDLVEDVDKTETLAEGLTEAQTTSEAAFAHAFLRTRPRSRADLGTGRGREKAQLSCNICRQRKTKCDRQQPCSTCTLRGQLCTYAPEKRGLTPLLPKSSPDAVEAMHDRLVQLERLVMQVSQNSAKKPESQFEPQAASDHQNQPLDAGTPTMERSEWGSMRMSGSEVHYVNDEHWAAIMDNIAVLKDHFDREEQLKLITSSDADLQYSSNHPSGEQKGALLLYGCRRPSSREEILASLPPRDALDRYISRYFNCVDLVASCSSPCHLSLLCSTLGCKALADTSGEIAAIHGPSFLRQYEAFWLDPSGISIIWVGLLFGIICLAVMATGAPDSVHGNEMEQQRLQIELYRERIVQCLVIGEYSKSGPYVLETMVHYVYVEMLLHSDSSKDIWYLLALEVNLAKRMGYHRDPSHFSGISLLDAEMRRRLWVTILLGDILISSQMGMPRMIVDWQCDTAEPQNLHDADIDLDSLGSAELPPARPETEHTTVLGVIARRRMLVALGAISDLTAATKTCSYAEVMRVDGILHEAQASIPPPLRMRPMASSITDSSQLIMSRLFLGHMFYKGQIMLHRRFLRWREDATVYSRKACLDASLGMLQIQHILDEETCPGGQLHMMRWRISSIMNHQFLTATMILCMLLQRGQTLQRDEEIRMALRKTRSVWLRGSAGSLEAQKGAEAVSMVLAKFGAEPRAQAGTSSRIYGGEGPGLTIQDEPFATNVNSSHRMADYRSGGVLQTTTGQSERGPLVGLDRLGNQYLNQATGLFIDSTEDDGTLEGWMMMNDIEINW